jgi:Kef-type K+ transport system membrane component KefB
MHTLFYVAILLISGIVVGRVASKFKLPNVTGYLIAGVLIGPSLLSLIPADVAPKLGIISEAALGFIAYSIGSEFNLNLIKKTGGKIILITVCEALGAVIMVVLAMIFIFKQSVAFSLVLGSIGAATAPAATIMVIRQYRAKGPLVSTLLPVVAMDDAVGIVVFGVAVAIADTITSSGQSTSFLLMVLKPFLEIALALFIGLVIGLVLSYISRKAKGKDDLLSISLATIFLTLGIAEFLNVSTLLSCMMLGATVSNMTYGGDKVIAIIDRFTPPVFIAFFTMAGVDLQLDILRNVGLVGMGYVVFRVIGKILGASFGAKMAQAPDVVQKYLGYTLIPQAGVAIGLSMLAESAIPGMGVEIRAIVLAGTVIYELVGPVISKMALIKAGEIAPEHQN